MAHFRSHRNPPHPPTAPSLPCLSSSSVFPSPSFAFALSSPPSPQIFHVQSGDDGLPVALAFDQPQTLDVGSLRVVGIADGVGSQFREDLISRDVEVQADLTSLAQSLSADHDCLDVTSWLNIPVEEDVYDICSPFRGRNLQSVPHLEVGNPSPTAPPSEDSSSQYGTMPIEAAFASGSVSCTSPNSYAVSTSISGSNKDWDSIATFSDTANSSLLRPIFHSHPRINSEVYCGTSPPTQYSEVSSDVNGVGTGVFPGAHASNDDGDNGGHMVEISLKSEILNVNDGFTWRKYGQKNIKNRTFPRSYFKCAQTDCPILKQIERSSENPECVLVRYKGKHNHPS